MPKSTVFSPFIAVGHADLAAKLQKKLVKNNGFWRINAIRPKIKAKRGRMRKYSKEALQILSGEGYAHRA
jgi:hypothetical protein